jgi:hypothetical protein
LRSRPTTARICGCARAADGTRLQRNNPLGSEETVNFMPGYSATPLPKKLGIKPGFRVALSDPPPEVTAELRAELAECVIVRDPKTPLDFTMVFTKSSAALIKEFQRIKKRLAPAGMFWVSWPKKSSGVVTDLDDNVVREIGLAAGLVDVKVCAVTEIWSGLKFVRRVKDR